MKRPLMLAEVISKLFSEVNELNAIKSNDNLVMKNLSVRANNLEFLAEQLLKNGVQERNE